MLPKVANHLLQHTSRAVAAVQNQTGHTIRNVLQLQSSSSPSGNWNGSTSSGRGGSGAGAGGAKFHSSRFNASVSSFHFSAISQHVRSRHAFAAALPPDQKKLYNHMVSSSVDPDSLTYTTLIEALVARDAEIHQLIQSRKSALVLYTDHEEETQQLHGAITRLENSRPFASAVRLFQEASSNASVSLPMAVLEQLLHASQLNGQLEVGTTIFEHARKEFDSKLSTRMWQDLLVLHGDAGDLTGAANVFNGFRKACKDGQMDISRSWTHPPVSLWGDMMYAYICHGQPDDALRLLEETLDAPFGAQAGTADISRPNAVVFNQIIRAFCETGDMQSALAWFDRLLTQSAPCYNPHEVTETPTKPSAQAWGFILHGLAKHGMFVELHRLLTTASSENLYQSTAADAFAVLTARRTYLLAHPETPSSDSVERLDLLVSYLLSPETILEIARSIARRDFSRLCESLIHEYNALGYPDRALAVATNFIAPVVAVFRKDGDIARDFVVTENYMHTSQAIVDYTVGLLSPTTSQSWGLIHAARLADLSSHVSGVPSEAAVAHLLDIYARSTSEEKDSLSTSNWETVFYCYVAAPDEVRMAIQPLDIFQDGISRGTHFSGLHSQTVKAVIDFLRTAYSGPQRMAIAAQLGISDLLRQDTDVETQASAEDMSTRSPASSLASPASPATGYTTPPSAPKVTINSRFDQRLSEILKYSGDNILEAYSRFTSKAAIGVYPSPTVIGRLINAVGRLGHLDKVQVLYDEAQKVLSVLDDTNNSRSLSWFQIEDQMVIALAHAGDVDAAHVHRQRILMQGGTPSPDAYGVLIQNVKDTTDDTANALTLFHEAVMHGVIPNVYLYNIVISKLAKARKADSALELFQEMKMRGLQPTSVTYGALIAACGRVGDVASAENLFTEMSSQPNFRPRIPPYNTMMQLYTQTKPNRERALFYYNSLVAANIRPSAHTYKLLLDTYGTIEPANVNAMEDVFNQLVSDRNVWVNGTHWAALINAYGCVQKDLDKAISIFESIKGHQSTTRDHPLPNAVVFEALINVFNTLRRADLIPQYVAKLPDYGIHMTAYIANLLIRGYAMYGNIDEARAVFNSLLDPPEGVAAPNNHAPHDSEDAVNVPVDAPVYREPSTWEAMVRGELANGNRDEALALLERVKARRFPAAVYNRISGVMLDDTVSPWSLSSDTVYP
ncbi:hypothetical protein BDW22DRAFT_1403107 [Trametopsis cervina]|nr:hypothetical protein BDW22DRAFT_1403107 [Trametopsis cervina]